MNAPRGRTPSSRSAAGRGGPARAIGALIPRALSEFGIPSRAATGRIAKAWETASEGRWQRQARPDRIQGGVLFVSVTSAALRQELAQFHAERLLAVMKALLPSDPVVGLRFVPADGPGA